jgi:hypothetical protein
MSEIYTPVLFEGDFCKKCQVAKQAADNANIPDKVGELGLDNAQIFVSCRQEGEDMSMGLWVKANYGKGKDAPSLSFNVGPTSIQCPALQKGIKRKL